MNITNSGSGAYIIDGASNPTLTVIRGVTYTFEINATGHPFWLQTAAGVYDSSNTYSTGVTNGGVQVGTITWQVALNAPDILYYVCQNHSSMSGQINVVNPGSTIETPAASLRVAGKIPYILRPCVLVPPTPEPEPEPESVISTPVSPGITYESLPVIDTATQIIDTSPDQIIGCANELPTDNEQTVLNSLFPDAVDGDGVVNRNNNDIWVLDSGVWNNVGPTPGPQLTVVSLVPPWNETILVSSVTRSKVEAVGFKYALANETELDIVAKTLISVGYGTFINVPSNFYLTMTAAPPRLSVNRKVTGKVVEFVYFTESLSPQFVPAPWPVSMTMLTGGAFDTILPTNSLARTVCVYDIARTPNGYWAIRDGNAEIRYNESGLDSPEIGFEEDGIQLPGRRFLTEDSSQEFGPIPQSQEFALLFSGTESPVTNTAGTRQSTVHESEAFTITTFTGTIGSAETVGHGLGSEPNFLIVKNLDNGETYFGGSILGGRFFYIDLVPGVESSASNSFTALTPSTVTLGSLIMKQDRFVLYSFKQVASLTKFDTYFGNGSPEGQYIDCGFTTSLVMIKPRGASRWTVISPKMRPAGTYYAILSFDSQQNDNVEFYSFEDNGFRVYTKSTGNLSTELNKPCESYIYMAFAGQLSVNLFCPSLSVEFSGISPAVWTSATITCEAPLSIAASGLPPVVVGKGATLVIVSRIQFLHQAISPSLGTGASLKVPAKDVEFEARPVNYAGQVVRAALHYLDKVELNDGLPLEAATRAAVIKFVSDLKTASLWDKIDTMVLMCGARTLSGALTALKGTCPDLTSSQLSYNYNRATGVKPLVNAYLFTRVSGARLATTDNHMAAYVFEDISGALGGGLMGNNLTSSGGMGIGRSIVPGSGFQSRNKDSATNTTSPPHWSEPSLIGVSRGDSANYAIRVAGSDRIVSSSTVTIDYNSTSEIQVFYTEPLGGSLGVGNYRIALYSLGKAVDLELLEEKVAIFMGELASAVNPGGHVAVSVVILNIQAYAPSRPSIARINVAEALVIQLDAINPTYAGPPGVNIGVYTVDTETASLPPLVSSGAAVGVVVRDIAIQSYFPVSVGPSPTAIVSIPSAGYALNISSGTTVEAEVPALLGDPIIPITGYTNPIEAGPFAGNYERFVMAATYSSTEMSDACGGASSATILGMRMEVVEAPSAFQQPFEGYSIGAKNTANSVATNNSGSSGGTFALVYGPADESFVTGETKEFLFDTPILWTGSNFVFSWAWCGEIYESEGSNFVGDGPLFYSDASFPGCFLVTDTATITQADTRPVLRLLYSL